MGPNWAALALSAWASPESTGPPVPRRANKSGPQLSRAEAWRRWPSELCGSCAWESSVVRVHVFPCYAPHAGYTLQLRVLPNPFSLRFFFLSSSPSFPLFFFPFLLRQAAAANSAFFSSSFSDNLQWASDDGEMATPVQALLLSPARTPKKYKKTKQQ